MERIHIGDDSGVMDQDDFDAKPTTLKILRNRVNKMSIGADVETRGRKVFVRVLDNLGTHHYMADGSMDYAYLNQHSYEKKKIGSATFFYFKF